MCGTVSEMTIDRDTIKQTICDNGGEALQEFANMYATMSEPEHVWDSE
jgi:hypothetical protein